MAWNKYADSGNEWTVPVCPKTVAEAREGRWTILLTPKKPVPGNWFPRLPGCEVLCLASGGGQQGPVLAAAGARVTVFDASPRQLEQDREVARREGLDLETVAGDMADLSCFPHASFDLIVHPVANCFVPDVLPVWREAFRVLRPGGVLLAGFVNPVLYLFDDEEVEQTGDLQVRYRVPFSDLESLPEERLHSHAEEGAALEFGHSLEDQIGGQLATGFQLTAMYEDNYSSEHNPLAAHLDLFIATRSVKN